MNRLREQTEVLRQRLDSMIAADRPFAAFRLPGEDGFLLAEGEATWFDAIDALSGKQGFVMAPFTVCTAHPIVFFEGRNATQIPIPPCEGASPTTLAEHPTEKERYEARFSQFIAPLRSGKLEKVVLSRSSEMVLPPTFSPSLLFFNAMQCYPRMMVYLCHTPQTGTWIGSSPELLMSGKGETWQTIALAGTMRVEGETLPTAWGTKDKEEQAHVARYIRDVLSRYGEEVEEEGPRTARAGHLAHLRTDFRFTLRRHSMGDVLNVLHPTPAVCGVPKGEALAFIADHEGLDRSYYAGFMGCASPQAESHLYVNLRCVQRSAGVATLYAGSGLLPSSDPHTEWQETCEKMKTIGGLI